MDDRIVKMPIEVLQDIIVKKGLFIFMADFVILDHKVDLEVSIILGRLFLSNGRSLVYMERGKMNFQFNNEEVILSPIQQLNYDFRIYS